MSRRRLALQAAIVVVVLALLSLPYVLPDRAGSRPSPSHSWAYCTEFRVGPTPALSADDAKAGQSTWTASFTISNAGPHGAILQTGSIVSRIRAGSESWPVSLGGRLLRPGATASIKIPLPVQAGDDARVWELELGYRTKISPFKTWLKALQDRLPRDLQVLDLPQVWSNQVGARDPENYEKVLTNALGWRFRVVGRGLGGGLHREWRPAVESATPFQRDLVEQMLTRYTGRQVVLTAIAPAQPTTALTNRTLPGPTLRGDLAFYVGYLDRGAEDWVRIRASASNEPGDDGLEVRVADVLGAGPAHENPGAAIDRAIEFWCGPQDLPSTTTARPARTTPLPPAGASDSRR